MPRAKAKAPKADPTPESPQAPVEVKSEPTPIVAPVTKQAVFTVYNSSGSPVREYSTDQHGPEAGSLAAEYAKKIGGSVK